jgi:hypothetical protein
MGIIAIIFRLQFTHIIHHIIQIIIQVIVLVHTILVIFRVITSLPLPSQKVILSLQLNQVHIPKVHQRAILILSRQRKFLTKNNLTKSLVVL